jgi:hypothetical protein
MRSTRPPLESQPPDVLFDGVYILHILLLGVGVVKPKVGFAAIPLGKTKVKAYRFGMANMQVAVGFWRETG